MNEISIFEAWALWWSGHLSPHSTIWGVSIFWWGRLGRTMQFVGAVTIIADIIGPEKIRKFGSSLQGAITPRLLTEFLKDCFEWYSIIFRHTLMKDYDDETPAAKKLARHSKLDLLNYVVCFLLTVVVVFSAKLQQAGWVVLIEAAIIFSCLLVSLSPLVTALIVIIFAATGLVANFVFIKSLARLLEHPSLDRSTKIASLLFLLLGFHFELLAS
ncbi:MAG: hypothetical protein HC866_05870 [Leptolyngbyaceae cyanobacterium RU_5_1]|nr:hypothetical protein [Leptolyngbyaceae cyanobacterium RU_5_1]